MSWGVILLKVLKAIGNIITLGLYAWLKRKYGPKS